MFNKSTNKRCNSRKYAMFMIAVLLIAAVFAIGVNAAKSNKSVYANESYNLETPYYELVPVLEKNFYETGEQINISFILDSQYDLTGLTCDANNFDLIESPNVNGNIITVILEYTSDNKAELTISVETVDKHVFTSVIYGYPQDAGFIISEYPEQNIGSRENVSVNNQNNINSFALTSVVTISGKLSWTDDNGNEYPLRNTRFEYGGASDFGSTYIPLTIYYDYTNEYGEYSLSLNTLGFDIYVTAYAKGYISASEYECVKVYQNDGLTTRYENFIYLSNPSSQTLTKNHIVGSYILDGNITKRAFEICQAVTRGAEYVREMQGGIDPSFVSVSYPSILVPSGALGIYLWGTLHIPAGPIEWETILHEYGHHLGLTLGLDKHPALNLECEPGWPPFQLVVNYHWENSMYDADEAGNSTKSQRTRITWAEAWADFFSKMAQQYYYKEISSIAGVSSLSIYENIAEGEASIKSIEAVLWKVYRNILNNGNINTITSTQNKHTHKLLWDAILISQSNADPLERNFSTFSNYFIENYPEYRSKFGEICQIHGMSPKDISLYGYSESVSPTITWVYNSPSYYYNVNRYGLVVYDSSGAQIVYVDNLSATSYKLSDPDWTKIKNIIWNGDYVNIHILAIQTATPKTGGFISPAFSLSLPIYTRSGNQYTITGMLNKNFNGIVKIFATQQEKPVTKIAANAFANSLCSKIIIPASVTIIENNAFSSCPNLTIFAEWASKPAGWSSDWNNSNRPVYYYSEIARQNYWSYVSGQPSIWSKTRAITDFGYLGTIYKWRGVVDMSAANPGFYNYDIATNRHTFIGNTNVTFKISTDYLFNVLSTISGTVNIALRNSSNQMIQIAGKDVFSCTVKVSLLNAVTFGGDGSMFAINTANLSNGTYTLSLTSNFTRASFSETYTRELTFIVNK